MAFELQAILLLAAAFMASYFIGSYRKHRLLTRYARWFDKEMSGIARVGFHKFGHAGIRIRCDFKHAAKGFRSMEFAIALAPRENLLHYPMYPFTKHSDTLSLWGFLNKPVKSDVEIMRTGSSRERTQLRSVSLSRTLSDLFEIHSSDERFAKSIVEDQAFRDGLVDMARDVKNITFERDASMMHMEAKLTPAKLPRILSLAWAAADALS